MTFSLRLAEPYSQQPPSVGDVAPAEDLVTLAIDGSLRLQDGGYQFHVSGFGDDRWPADVAYDLALVIEQLPGVISALDSRKPTAIEFVGQGIERVVDLTPAGAEILARCRSGTLWVPDPAVEVLILDDHLGELRQLVRDYVAGLRLVAPTLAASKPARLLWKSTVG